MYSWLFSSILNYQLYIRRQQYIVSRQYIYSQQYIQQYIQLQARAEYTTHYSALLYTTSQSQMCSLLFSSKFYFQLYIRHQQSIQQYVQLPAEANCTTGYSAVHKLPTVYSPPAVYSAVCPITSQGRMNSWILSRIFNYQTELNLQLVIQQQV